MVVQSDVVELCCRGRVVRGGLSTSTTIGKNLPDLRDLHGESSTQAVVEWRLKGVGGMGPRAGGSHSPGSPTMAAVPGVPYEV